MNDNKIIPFKRPSPPDNNHGTPKRPSPPPMINLPHVTKLFLVSFFAIHFLIYAIGLTFFSPLPRLLPSLIGFVPSDITQHFPLIWWGPLQIITYAFLHDGWLHLAVNSVMFAASASGIERLWGWKKMVILFLGSSIIAALTHLAFYPTSDIPIIGASGGISGLFGAMIFLIQNSQNNGQPNNVMWRIIAIWIAISVISGMLGAPNGMPIAWLTHIGGFIGGIGLAMQLRKTSM